MQVASASFGSSTVTAQITSFSWVQVNGLLRSDPVREWEFGGFPGNGGAEVSFGGATQVGGLLEQVVSFGSTGFAEFPIVTFTESIPADGTARGYIFGTPDGVTYGVYAESPFAKLGESEPIGSIARLKQTQSFIKLSPDATLTFTLTSALVSAFDFNAFAPGVQSLGVADTSVSGELYLEVHAYTTTRSFFHTAGGATVSGTREAWEPNAWNYRFSRTPLWSLVDFEFEVRVVADPGPLPCIAGGTRADLELKAPRTYSIDLSSIAVGEEFTLRSDTFAKTNNRRGGGAPGDCQASGSNAFLRDPLRDRRHDAGIHRPAADRTDPALSRRSPTPVAPAACVPGPAPDPAAGVIQFSAATYTIGEFAGAAPTSPSRATAAAGRRDRHLHHQRRHGVAGADYTPVNVTRVLRRWRRDAARRRRCRSSPTRSSSRTGR